MRAIGSSRIAVTNRSGAKLASLLHSNFRSSSSSTMAAASVLSAPAAPAAANDPPTAALARISLSKAVATPPDYARFAFSLPAERYVGLLKCQLDPYCRELETVVVRCQKKTAAAVARSNGKEKGKQKAGQSQTEPEGLWEVELLDTPLFPEGGGQASDTGSLHLLDQPDREPVIVREVVRRHLAAVHMCTAPIEPGTRVLATVDWERRHDLCTQHTAQHLLSAVLEHHFKLPTLGWALSAFPGLSYVELPRSPSRAELQETEKLCNALIVEGRRVRVDMALADDGTRPDTLPKDYIGGVVRTVVIDDLDENPCCGTHYSSLAPLQGIHVSPFTTPIRGTNTRVYFLAGPRIATQLTSALESVKGASQALSCSSDEVAQRTQQLLDAQKDTLRREKRLREELAEFVALRVLREAQDIAGVTVAAHIRQEDGTNDQDFLLQIYTKLKDELADRPFVFALAQVGNTTPSPDGCLLIGASDEAVVKRIGEALKKGETAFGSRLRGGGKGRWQGKLSEGRFVKERDEPALLELLKGALQ